MLQRTAHFLFDSLFTHFFTIDYFLFLILWKVQILSASPQILKKVIRVFLRRRLFSSSHKTAKYYILKPYAVFTKNFNKRAVKRYCVKEYSNFHEPFL